MLGRIAFGVAAGVVGWLIGRSSESKIIREVEKSEYDIVFNYAKKIENILDVNFNAKGKGLHQKISSVEEQLKTKDIKALRFIATIRNIKAHEEKEIDIKEFKEAFEFIKKRFNNNYKIKIEE